MATTTGTMVTGVFATQEEAHRAVAELRRAGFTDEQLGVAAGPEQPGQEPGCKAEGGITIGSGAGFGLLGGAALGGLATAALPGMLAAGAAGALLGALIDLGIPEDSACFYQKEWEAGRTLVTVRADGREAAAADLLRRQGAREVRR